jgi:hypothetical protein
MDLQYAWKVTWPQRIPILSLGGGRCGTKLESEVERVMKQKNLTLEDDAVKG